MFPFDTFGNIEVDFISMRKDVLEANQEASIQSLKLLEIIANYTLYIIPMS